MMNIAAKTSNHTHSILLDDWVSLKKLESSSLSVVSFSTFAR